MQQLRLDAVDQRNHGQRHEAVVGRSATSFARWRLNPADSTALESVAASARWVTDHGAHLFGSLNQGWLGEMHATTGHPEATRRSAVAALFCARRGDWVGVGMAGHAMARVHAAAAQAGRASFWLRQAE